MKKEKKQCNAFVEDNNARCKKYVWAGTGYCFSHFPKKEPILLSVIVAIIIFLITLVLTDPLNNNLSKIPPFYYLDKNDPFILTIIPDIERSKRIDKDTKFFKIFCSDKNSGLDLSQCFINIFNKNGKEYKPVRKEIDKAQDAISLILDGNIKNGEYTLEVWLSDKNRNSIIRRFPFVIREDNDLEYGGWYKRYEESNEKIRFGPFIENNKYIIQDEDLYVYYLELRNKDENAVLKNFYFNIDTRGGVVLSWEEVGGLNTKGARLFSQFEKRFPTGKIFMNWYFLNIDEMGPEGFITFAILVGVNKKFSSSPVTDKRHQLVIRGQYFSEGYGTSETHKIKEDTIYLPEVKE